jgi:hypothetical protein
MLRYNWERIMKLSNGKISNIITILRMLTYNQIPKNYYDDCYKYYGKNLTGNSFILNPKRLLEIGRTYSDREVVEYAGVASFRSLAYYHQTKDTTLDLMHLDVSEDIIYNNRLLDIKANRVHFLFEKPLTGEENGNKI